MKTSAITVRHVRLPIGAGVSSQERSHSKDPVGPVQPEPPSSPKKPEHVWELQLTAPLQVRITHTLRIGRVDKLVEHTEDSLQALALKRNFSFESAELEILSARLAKHGLSLKPSLD